MRNIAHTLFVGVLLIFLSSTTLAQDSTLPPSGYHPILTLIGRGVQIYLCQNATGAPQWVFQTPEAALFDSSGGEVGKHGAGPIWKNRDGSTVTGQPLVKLNAPDPSNIPWLLLRAQKHEGDGVLSHVEYIRRSDTKGGIATGSGCDAGHLKAASRVPYEAVYTFYAPNP